MLGQQGFDFAPQRLVIAARFSQEGVALVLIPLEDGVVDPLDPLPAAGLHNGMISAAHSGCGIILRWRIDQRRRLK